MASSSSSLDVQIELKSEAAKIWKALHDSVDVFPKALPHIYKSIQVLEGDGHSPGSIRVVKFAPGTPHMVESKEKIEKVDENRVVTYSVIGGDMLKHYKNIHATLNVTPKGSGCVVSWSCEFEKLSKDTPNPDFMKELARRQFQELDAYLQKP